MATPISDPQRLLLAFVAHVQDTGLCDFPALDAHLYRYGLDLQAQAIATAAATATVPEPQSLDPSADGPDSAASAPAQPHATASERDASSRSQPLTSPSPEYPVSARQNAEAEPTALLAPDDSDHSGDHRAGPASSAAGGFSGAKRSMLIAGAGRDRHTAAAHGTGSALPMPHRKSSPRAIATTQATTAHPSAPASMPQLDLLLRFREQLESKGWCDHPELQDRLEQRQIVGLDPRLTLERLQHRCLQRLRQSQRDLAELQEEQQAPMPSSATHSRTAKVAMALSQLRLLVVDGLASYQASLGQSQQRLRRRQLARAANLDGQVQRLLRRSGSEATLESKLQALASTLQTVLEQWLPSELLLAEEPSLAAPDRRPTSSQRRRLVLNGIRLRRLPSPPERY